VSAGENVLTAALAAGIPLPHSCRAGRCATCKARLLSGEIAYPDDKLPPGIVASEAARGEVLLCQARPRSDLRIQARQVNVTRPMVGIEVERTIPLSTGGLRVTLRFLGADLPPLRPGQFIDVENAAGERERVPLVAVTERGADVEVLELEPRSLVRARGPFDSPR
jgi:CDP-4-dehydro-6-deoxyglucose reductase